MLRIRWIRADLTLISHHTSFFSCLKCIFLFCLFVCLNGICRRTQQGNIFTDQFECKNCNNNRAGSVQLSLLRVTDVYNEHKLRRVLSVKNRVDAELTESNKNRKHRIWREFGDMACLLQFSGAVIIF